MKRYSYKLVKDFIEKNRKNIDQVVLGMSEDWGWTSDVVFSNNKYKNTLEDGACIAGIDGSDWATPSMEVTYKDGTKIFVPAHDNAKSEEMNDRQKEMIEISSCRTYEELNKQDE